MIKLFIFASLYLGAFTTEEIQVGSMKISVEVADDEQERSQGLMFRKTLKENEGMLFVFSSERPLAFWMKNTFVALSIGFFDTQGKLVDMQDMEPVKSEMQTMIPQYQSKKNARYALEVVQGWFKKHKIKLGDRLVRANQSR